MLFFNPSGLRPLPEMSRFQIEPVSLRIRSPGATQAPLFLAGQLCSQALGKVVRDVALHLGDVGRLAHVMRAPKLTPVERADQVGLHPHFVAVLGDASHQDRTDLKLLPNFLRVVLLTLEPEDTATRQDFEIGQLGTRCQSGSRSSRR